MKTVMTKLRWGIAIGLLSLVIGAGPAESAAAGNRVPPRNDDQPRRNIGRFFEKLRRDRTVTIAFLGGGTMAGVGATRPDEGSYRALVASWLRSQAAGVSSRRPPSAGIETINAAVPGTGALYATLRLRRDLLALKPDLVLIEFGPDDRREDPRTAAKAVEGILRQLLVQAEPPEILLLYPALPAGEAPVAAAEEMARHYGVPSIDLRAILQSTSAQNGTDEKGFWTRGGELNDAGHQIHAARIIQFLAEQLRQSPSPLARRLPPPSISDELNYGEFRVLAEFIQPWPIEAGQKSQKGPKENKGWKSEKRNEAAFPTRLAVSNRPGAMLETFFEGTVLGLTWEKGPDAGMIEVLIDGRPAPAPLGVIDGYAAQPGIGTAVIAGGLGLGEHRLTIRVRADRHPLSRGHRIRLGYLLIGGQRPEKL